MYLPLKWRYTTPACDVSPLSKDGSLHRMLTLDTETSSMLLSTVEAVKPKAISKLSAMFCNHSCMAVCFCLRILAVAHTLCSAWALGACGNPFLYITGKYILRVIHEIRSRCLGRQSLLKE